jgi:hypothetical protein
MADEEKIPVSPELLEEFQLFEEFCSENSGRELAYFQMVEAGPLEMDTTTLAFCMRHLVRLTRELMDLLLKSLNDDEPPELQTILAVKGIQLDKAKADAVRSVIFAFRDHSDREVSSRLVRALQLMTISREKAKVNLRITESYAPPEEGWTSEDFGGDESLLQTVRSIEDPHWITSEES